MEIDNDCVTLFAKFQPIAFDLRFITSVIKINNDFERIGDQTVNIAERGLTLASRPGTALLWSTVAVAAAALALPYVPAVAATFGFVPLPPLLMAMLLAITFAYVLANEWAKRRFQQRFGL